MSEKTKQINRLMQEKIILLENEVKDGEAVFQNECNTLLGKDEEKKKLSEEK